MFLLYIKNNLKNKLSQWSAKVLNQLPGAYVQLAYIFIQSPGQWCCFCNQMLTFKYQETGPHWPIFPPGYQGQRLGSSCPPMTQSSPFPSVFLHPQQRHKSSCHLFNVYVIVVLRREENIPLYPCLCHGQKRKISISQSNTTHLFYFLPGSIGS